MLMPFHKMPNLERLCQHIACIFLDFRKNTLYVDIGFPKQCIKQYPEPVKKDRRTGETKMCPVCGRPFGNRKKWESRGVWDQVIYCSDRCRRRGGAAKQKGIKDGMDSR